MRADNLYKRYNLDPDIVIEKLVKFKNFYELMEENSRCLHFAAGAR